MLNSIRASWALPFLLHRNPTHPVIALLLPLFRLPPHTLPVRPILLTSLDKQNRAVVAATQMALQVFPAAIGPERATGMGTAVRTQILHIALAKLS
jgi:hypothetical protein